MGNPVTKSVSPKVCPDPRGIGILLISILGILAIAAAGYFAFTRPWEPAIGTEGHSSLTGLP